jgi:hypothetical protein
MGSGYRQALAVLAVLVALVAAGCGSSEETTASKPEHRRLVRYHFIFHASLICKKGLEQADLAMHRAAGKPTPTPPSSAPDWEESFDLPVKVVLPAFRRIMEGLEAQEPPKDYAYRYNAFISRLQADMRQAEAHPGEPISSRPLSNAGKTAYVYGLHACLF